MNILDKIYKLKTEDFNKFWEYQMTNKEIEELENNVYDMTCSIFPLGDFLNDIKWNSAHNPRYNTQQALKDFCLIVYHINYWEKRSWALEIIDKKNVDIELLKDACCVEDYNNVVIYKHRQLTQQEFDLLKERY